MNQAATALVAYGAISAAVIAGFFSFLNLISSKENAVSEYRQKWIDGIRIEIARLTGAIHELVRIEEASESLTEKERLEIAKDPLKDARESIASIQLRLNPEHIKKKPKSKEAILWTAITKARQDFNKVDLNATVDDCDLIREAAAPLLKAEWERVKKGELIFRIVRVAAFMLVLVGITFVALGARQLVQVS